MSKAVPASVIAEAMGQTKRHINDRATTERWYFETQLAQGGRQKLYPVLTLPAKVRAPVLAHLAKAEAVTAAALAPEKLKSVTPQDNQAAAAARQLGLAKFVSLPEASKRRADAQAALIELAAYYVKISGMAKSRGEADFCNQYCSGAIEVPEWVRAEVSALCPGSLRNWRNRLKSEGLAGLAPKYGQHRKGSGLIDTTPELRDFIIAMIFEFPHCEPANVMRGIEGRFEPFLHPHMRTLQRWMERWKDENRQLLLKIANPDAWRSKFMAAFGKADGEIVRLNQRWETDSTKGDLMCIDPETGQKSRHNIVGIIDVYSRRIKFHVSRTSSAAAVASLFRSTILAWGVPEVLGTDNGSDFVSHYIKRVVAGLDIHQDIAPPFTPDHKPFIERGFGTLNHGLMELLTGYIGHNVVERKAIESRRSFADRLMRKGQSDAPIELLMSPAQLQAWLDSWAEHHYHHKPHSGLNGETPFQRAAAWKQAVRRITDERALDVLLAPAPGSGSAGGEGKYTVGKKGIRFNNSFYADLPGKLGPLVGQEVLVRLDESEIGRIFVFSVATGEFICVAECPELTGIFNQKELSAAMKVAQKKANSDGIREIKTKARKANVRDVAHDTLRRDAINAGKLVMLPTQSVEHTTDALREAGLAAGQIDDTGASRVHAREGDAPAASAQLIQLHPVRDAAQIEQDQKDGRFAKYQAIDRAIAAGEDVSERDRRWHRTYGMDAEYRARLKAEQMILDGRIAG